VAFTNEEGVRYHTDMLGSQAFCGFLTVEAARAVRGVDGSQVGQELERIGYAGDFQCASIYPHAYLELHIEQGPLLDRVGIPIGVVEAITGISWQEVTVRGAANHAGTTPMDSRRDAGLAAARIVSQLPELAAGLPGQKATCGRFTLDPGAVNVVPRAAVFTVDLRNGDEKLLEQAEERLAALAEKTAATAGCTTALERIGYARPADCDPGVVQMIEAAAVERGYAFQRMTSGAGHDAQFLARRCPTGMIFIPSREGVSHSPHEYSSPEAVEAGANVLLAAALRLME
jgi:N-carbamoyl-L-amino-acid hydrolase